MIYDGIMAESLQEICRDAAPFCTFSSLSTEYYSPNYLRNWSKRWVPACYWSNEGMSGDPLVAYYVKNLLLIPNSYDLFQILPSGIITEILSYSSESWRDYCRSEWPSVHNPNLSISTFQAQDNRVDTLTDELIFPLLWHSDHNHYWHFTFDIAFRLFYLISTAPDIANNLTLLVLGQNELKSFQLQILASILGDKLNIKYSMRPLICREAIYIAPAHTLLQNKPWLTKYSSFLKNCFSRIYQPPFPEYSTHSTMAKTTKIYIKRGKAANPRYLTNELDLISMLEDRSFEVIDPGSLSLSEQINYFKSATLILGLHGAAFTNLIYMKKKSLVLELTNTSYDPFTLFLLGKQLDLLPTRLCTKTSPENFIGHVPFALNLHKVTRYLDLYI